LQIYYSECVLQYIEQALARRVRELDDQLPLPPGLLGRLHFKRFRTYYKKSENSRVSYQNCSKIVRFILVAKLLNDSGWEVQESLDPELEVGHSRELYWIWNEKSAMLKYVSETNPFSSEYFAWLDIGAIRHSRWNGRVLMQNLPEEAGILLLQVGEFEDSELVLKDGLSHSDFFQKNRIGGGMIGGSAESVRIWADLFYKTIKRYFSLNRFGGKDQSVMATTCLESDVCLLLDGSPAHPWFYNEPRWFRLQNYYLGDLSQQPSRMNLSAVKRTL